MSQGITCEQIARALGNGREINLGGNRGWNTLCPAHNDSGPSLSIKEADGKLLVYCHAGCAAERVIDELKSRDLWRSSTTWAVQKLAPTGTMVPVNISHLKFGKPSKIWSYYTVTGKLVGNVCRFETIDKDGKKGKVTLPLTWCRSSEGQERWFWKGFAEPRHPYNEQLLAIQDRPILLVEGEKTAEAAAKLFLDYLVLTWQGGSKAVKRTDWKLLKNRNVTIWPDADPPGDQAARELAEILLAEGVRTLRRVTLPDYLPQGWDLADEPVADMDMHQLLRSAPEYKPLGDEVVERFNREFAAVLLGGHLTIIKEEILPDGQLDLQYISSAAFKEFYGNRHVISGRTSIPESHYWLKHESRRSYHNVVFKPGTDYTGKEYNLWRGFSVDPDPAGDWSLLDQHILKNICQDREDLYYWVLGWFAHLVQFPGRKSGTSLALRGKMGSGKTILGKFMGQLYRPHYVHIAKSHYIMGQFNSHLASCLLLHADEAFWAGDPRQIGQLKDLVTSDVQRIEPKGKDSFEVGNYVRLLVTSNNTWVIPAGFEERRFAVLDVGDGNLQDRVFFKAMDAQMSDGGLGGLLYYLQNFNLGQTDVHAIPDTEALQEQKTLAMDSITRFWYHCLAMGEVVSGAGGWAEYAITDDLYNYYICCCDNWREYHRSDYQQFLKRLSNWWPGKNPELKRIPFGNNGNRRRMLVLALMPLERMRAEFEYVVGGKFSWLPGEDLAAGVEPQEHEGPEAEIPF